MTDSLDELGRYFIPDWISSLVGRTDSRVFARCLKTSYFLTGDGSMYSNQGDAAEGKVSPNCVYGEGRGVLWMWCGECGRLSGGVVW